MTTAISANPTDDLGQTCWDDSVSTALREAGFKIVRFGKTMTYIGQVDLKNQPEGNGYMCFSNGDVHEGKFISGRADGPGTLLTAKGVQYKGAWNQNRRVGKFDVIDASGTPWTEKYNNEGKKTARKKK